MWWLNVNRISLGECPKTKTKNCSLTKTIKVQSFPNIFIRYEPKPVMFGDIAVSSRFNQKYLTNLRFGHHFSDSERMAFSPTDFSTNISFPSCMITDFVARPSQEVSV